MSGLYHLAQVNIGRMLGPIDCEIMTEFVRRLADVNAAADCSPGFVWRLQSETGDATSVRAYEDPLILFNLSVWESLESLKNYTYSGPHIELFRRRSEWFEKPTAPNLAMWWVRAGHIPSIEEAVARLELRRAQGDTPEAFSFAHPFPAPEREAAAGRQVA